MRNIVIGLWFCLGTACASTLEAKGAMGDEEEGFEKDGQFKSRIGDDRTETIVDADDETAWHRFDLDTGKPDEDDARWDLAFRRYVIRSNGGVNGEAGVELALLTDVSFDDLEAAPSAGFSEDRADDAEDENTDSDNVFNSPDASWYDYNLMTHALSPRDVTYVIHSSEGAYFKLRFDAYYDKAGSPAQIRFSWAEIDGPE
jgi:hypothetical protein